MQVVAPHQILVKDGLDASVILLRHGHQAVVTEFSKDLPRGEGSGHRGLATVDVAQHLQRGLDGFLEFLAAKLTALGFLLLWGGGEPCLQFGGVLLPQPLLPGADPPPWPPARLHQAHQLGGGWDGRTGLDV